MWYLIYSEDVPDSLPLRKQVRPAHLARLQALQDEGRLLTAGPNPAIDAEDPADAGFTGSTWAGMLAPAGTPREIVKRMSDEVTRIIRSDETRARLDTMGTFAAGTSPEEFDTFIAAETAKWSKVIKDAGVKPD